MLSYQHIYHAGNAADVHKHAALSVLLAHLTQKEKPLTYLETHAGRGVYDLASKEALKTDEARYGVYDVLKHKKLPDSHPYVSLIRRLQSEVGKTLYPGSPFIAEALLRPTDSIHLMELHPREYDELRYWMRYPNVHMHHRDGYEGVLALSPPPVRRGFVLIDPSYEVKTEYALVAATVLKLIKKWPQAHVMIWYPLLKEGRHAELCSPLEQAQTNGFYKQEIRFKHPDGRMTGSGFVLLNAPYGTKGALDALHTLF